MSIDQEYKDFSKWCRDNPAYDLDPRLHTHSGRINDGGYILHKRTGTAFKAWQASREALEGEPVAWWDGDTSAAEDSFSFKSNGYYTIPLYTHPASSQAVSVPERSELIDLLISTRNQSEGATADLILGLIWRGLARKAGVRP